MKTAFMLASSSISYVAGVAIQTSVKQSTAAQLAHVFRRTGFGPKPGQVEQWIDRGPEALVASLLDNDEFYLLEEENLYDQVGGVDSVESELIFAAVIDEMLNPVNPLHERMTWYWHTHFTSSVESSAQRFAWQQHHLLRRHALGDFADLARAVSTDPAMLFYLDGAGSNGDNPNENYAREFLELFTLGRDGGYTEGDVRAAARIFSGWHVDWETGVVEFNPDSHYDRPVSFMGQRQRWTIDSFVTFICSLPACHQHVVTRLYHHLVGSDLSDARRNELAAVFAESGLQIKALLQAMLTGEDFLNSANSRTRQPLEWALGALQVVGFDSVDDVDLKPWQIEALGQMPFRPPNAAGWPLDDRWATTNQVVARTSLLLDWELSETVVNSVAPTVDAVLARCAIFDPSPSTRAALDRIENEFSEFDYRLELLFITALTSPEFTLL